MKNLVLAVSMLVFTSCSGPSKKTEVAEAPSPLDVTLGGLSLLQLHEASLAFKVAYEKSMDSWQGPIDDAIPGCKISGFEAENGIAALKPWLAQRTKEEAEKLLSSPKSHTLPVNSETCEQDCSCELGVQILSAANLDGERHSRVKDLKRLRTRFEAKAELLTGERAELCAEGSKWICTSDFLKSLKAASAGKR